MQVQGQDTEPANELVISCNFFSDSPTSFKTGCWKRVRSLPHAPGVSGNHLAGLDRKQGLSKQTMHGNISLSSGHWSLFHVICRT